jgi:predicted nucleic acid-binding protein
MIYLDSSIFLNAILDSGKTGEKARKIIRQLQDNTLKAATSILTYDEIVWVVKKHRNMDDAIISGKDFLETPNLVLLDVNGPIIWQAQKLIENYKINPRDAIHAASAIAYGVFTVISEDSDFDKIKEIQRKRL